MAAARFPTAGAAPPSREECEQKPYHRSSVVCSRRQIHTTQSNNNAHDTGPASLMCLHNINSNREAAHLSTVLRKGATHQTAMASRSGPLHFLLPTHATMSYQGNQLSCRSHTLSRHPATPSLCARVLTQIRMCHPATIVATVGPSRPMPHGGFMLVRASRSRQNRGTQQADVRLGACTHQSID